jgi:large subunit ribosomal protein L6
MSRVGKHPVSVPSGVSVQIEGGTLRVKGKLGELVAAFPSDVTIRQEGGQVVLAPVGEEKRARMMWGTARNIARNLVDGVDKGYSRRLEIQGVGYRAQVQGEELVLQLGFSHEIRHPIPEGVKVECPDPTHIAVSGADKQKVGQVAAEIRAYRRVEPYKGKGIRYEGERVRRKEGKKK